MPKNVICFKLVFFPTPFAKANVIEPVFFCIPSLQDVDHLKPHIVHALANAELYCMALSILYSDPNYHNLNHWGIIQALARKGIYVAEPADCALTETVLIQTNPLKMVSSSSPRKLIESGLIIVFGSCSRLIWP